MHATLVVGGCVVGGGAGCKNGTQVGTVVVVVGTGLLHDPGGEKAVVKAKVRTKVEAEMEAGVGAEEEEGGMVEAEMKKEVGK